MVFIPVAFFAVLGFVVATNVVAVRGGFSFNSIMAIAMNPENTFGHVTPTVKLFSWSLLLTGAGVWAGYGVYELFTAFPLAVLLSSVPLALCTLFVRTVGRMRRTKEVRAERKQKRKILAQAKKQKKAFSGETLALKDQGGYYRWEEEQDKYQLHYEKLRSAESRLYDQLGRSQYQSRRNHDHYDNFYDSYDFFYDKEGDSW